MSSSASARSTISVPAGPAAACPRPTPEIARMVQLSCQRLATVQAEFADTFRSTLNETVPGMRKLSLADSAVLSARLADCVLWAALTQDSSGMVEATLQRVGADNYRRGFPDDAYLGVGRALLRSVRDSLGTSWDSRLGSAWVDYCRWLDTHLGLGAQQAQDGRATEAPDPGTGASGAGARTLETIFQNLRSTYFAGDERSLGAICTRVMLRTGADLRAPRPDQVKDPAVIAHVLESLLLMGFAPAPPTSVPIGSPGTPGPGRSAPDGGRERAAPPRRRWPGWLGRAASSSRSWAR